MHHRLDGAHRDEARELRVERAQLDAALAQLERCGGRMVERMTLEPGGTPSAIVLDPDGYRVQI